MSRATVRSGDRSGERLRLSDTSLLPPVVAVNKGPGHYLNGSVISFWAHLGKATLEHSDELMC